MNNEQIEDLVRNAQKGDQQAFSLLVKDNQHIIIRYCYAMLTNRQDAEDITQDTFIKAYQHLHRYSYEGNFLGWLITIAHRLCLNRLKKNKRMFNLILHMKTQQKTEVTHHDLTNQEIFSLLNSLKPNIRAIVILKVIHGYSFEEISKIVGGNSTNLRKQFERAKKSLQHKESLLHNKKESEANYDYKQKLRATNP